MKKIIRSLSLIIIAFYLFIAALYVSGFVKGDFVLSSIYAGLLNFLNSFFAFMAFEISYKQNNQIFLIMNLGGMGIRLLFLLIGVLIIIKFLNIDEYGFISLFFIFYFILLTFEIYFLSSKVENRQNPKV